jgi:hypothetical protein
MHIRQSPFGFFTSTGLAVHSGQSTFRMTPASSNFFTSFFTAICLSSPIFRFFCLTGLAPGMRWSLCSAMSRGIPGMSAADHANTDWLSRRKLISSFLTSPCTAFPIFVYLPTANSTCSTSSVGSSWVLVSVLSVGSQDSSVPGVIKSALDFTCESRGEVFAACFFSTWCTEPPQLVMEVR